MRVDDGALSFEVVLDSGRVLPEVTKNGATYVVASPGKTFSVRVTNNKPGVTYKVRLRVDGVDVGYTLPVQWGRSTSFRDILVHAVGEVVQRKLLQFRDASRDRPVSRQPTARLDTIQMGRLVFEVVEVVAAGTKRRREVHTNTHAAPKAVKLPDGKKWYEAPSLCASDGPLTTGKIEWSTTRRLQVGLPRQYTLRYETALTLMLRGILQQDHPAHSKLIQRSLRREAERVAAGVVKPEPAASSRRGNRASASHSLSQLGKRSRTNWAHGQQSRAVADLRIGQDDLVVCDLTGRAPTWHWSKKPPIVLD